MSLPRFIGLLMAACVIFVAPAKAVPVLSLEFIDSGQTFAATDVVITSGRITNSGDPFSDGILLFTNVGPLPPGPLFDNYVFTPIIPGLVTLGTGESLDLPLLQWDPWPITGNFGDPVADGTYTFPLALITLDMLVISPFGFHPITNIGGDFVWMVGAASEPPGDELPAPAPLALILVGLAALRFIRRRI